jgi:hypothetical protein
MAIQNKVTTLRSPDVLTDAQIQEHFDEHNSDGWYIVGVDNLVGWYRFFWAKVTE